MFLALLLGAAVTSAIAAPALFQPDEDRVKVAQPQLVEFWGPECSDTSCRIPARPESPQTAWPNTSDAELNGSSPATMPVEGCQDDTSFMVKEGGCVPSSPRPTPYPDPDFCLDPDPPSWPKPPGEDGFACTIDAECMPEPFWDHYPTHYLWMPPFHVPPPSHVTP